MTYLGLLRRSGLALTFLAACSVLQAAPYDDLIDGCKTGDVAKVEAAISAGADVNTLDAGGNPPLTTAVFWEGVVDALLKAGANPNLGKLTPLYNAAGNGCTETVKLLLAKGADVNNSQVPGSYPLEYAIQSNNNADVVKLLIEAGAKTDIKNSSGANLIYIWADSGNPADKIKGAKGTAELLEKSYGFKMPEWYKNQDTGNDPEGVLKLLVENKVDINAPATEGIIKGWTPLLATLRVERPEKARMLVANGADVKTTINIDMPKLTYHPICLAAEWGNTELVKLMIEKGADVNVQAQNSALLGNSNITNCVGLSALNIAFMFGHFDAAKLLLDAGADPKVGLSGSMFLPFTLFESRSRSNAVHQTIKNKSAIFFAIESGNIEMINKVGAQLEWKSPPKFVIDAHSKVVFSGAQKLEVTFRKESHTPSSWAEKLKMEELAKSLKKRKM